MTWWKAFWDGLNIRKFVVILVGALYGTYMLMSKQDLGVRDMLLMVVSYYFGYSNGQTQDGAKK